MLLFNVFLRPTLMVFGLIAAMALASVLVELIQDGFWQSTGNQGLKLSVTALCVYLTIYVFMIVTMVNKAFSLIYVIPEKVMRWIGGQGESYGEEHALGEVKGAGEKASAGVAEKQKGAGKAGGDIAKTSQKQGEAEKKRSDE